MRENLRVIGLCLVLVCYIKTDSENSAFKVKERLLNDSTSLELGAIDLAKPPSPGQRAIDQAMILFDIKVSKDVDWPLYDPYLEDYYRAIALQEEVLGRKSILIGKASFYSWGVLGSTLAHEIEVHGRQSIFWLSLRARLFGISAASAEVEAYNYEIYSAKRFGLTKEDISSLKEQREDQLRGLFKDSKRILKDGCL